MNHNERFAAAAKYLEEAIAAAEATLEALGMPSACVVPIPPARLPADTAPLELWWRRERGAWGLFVRKDGAVRNSATEFQHLNDCSLRVKCAAVAAFEELREQLVSENRRTIVDVERAAEAAWAFAQRGRET